MFRQKAWSTVLLATSLVIAGACAARDEDRSAVKPDTAVRGLDLALKSDSNAATFEDTATAPPKVTPKPQRDRTPAPAARATRPVPDPTPPPVEPPQRSVEPPAPPAPRNVETAVASGTTLSLTLNETLSTQTNREGDSFTATLAEPVRDTSGDVVIPAGALVRGRVTQVQKSGHVGETAVLSLAFEQISWPDGSYPLEASVVSANPERVTRQKTGEQVGKVATGAVAGAILGRVLGGNGKGALKGAIVGAAAGTAIAMGTADVDAVLRSGSAMMIRLDQPVRLTKVVT